MRPSSSDSDHHITLISCGAPLARRHRDIASALQERFGADNTTSLITANAAPWTGTAATPWRVPTNAKRPRTNLIVALPITFNTANKIAAGIADTPAAALLCEALGNRIPIIAGAMLKTALAAHPTWQATTRTLTETTGWHWLDLATGQLADTPHPIESGQGDVIAESFDPQWVIAAVQNLTTST